MEEKRENMFHLLLHPSTGIGIGRGERHFQGWAAEEERRVQGWATEGGHQAKEEKNGEASTEIYLFFKFTIIVKRKRDLLKMYFIVKTKRNMYMK